MSAEYCSDIGLEKGDSAVNKSSFFKNLPAYSTHLMLQVCCEIEVR